VFNVPHILVRWCFTRWGYVLGTGVLQRIQKSGMMESLTYGASIIGLMVVGAMTASMIDITIPLSFGAGGQTQVQDIINDILPCMLPLVSFGIVYWLLGGRLNRSLLSAEWRWWAFWVRGSDCFNGSELCDQQ
jgi:fructoselysine and glucoselysine-specific PTS system IID component